MFLLCVRQPSVLWIDPVIFQTWILHTKYVGLFMSVSRKSFQSRSYISLIVHRPKTTNKNVGLGLRIHLGMKLKQCQIILQSTRLNAPAMCLILLMSK